MRRPRMDTTLMAVPALRAWLLPKLAAAGNTGRLAAQYAAQGVPVVARAAVQGAVHAGRTVKVLAAVAAGLGAGLVAAWVVTLTPGWRVVATVVVLEVCVLGSMQQDWVEADVDLVRKRDRWAYGHVTVLVRGWRRGRWLAGLTSMWVRLAFRAVRLSWRRRLTAGPPTPPPPGGADVVDLDEHRRRFDDHGDENVA